MSTQEQGAPEPSAFNPRDALRGVVMAAMGKDATGPMVEAMTEKLASAALAAARQLIGEELEYEARVTSAPGFEDAARFVRQGGREP